MRTASLRVSMLYGERDSTVLPSQMKLSPNIQIGDNTNLVSCTYAGSSAEAHVLAGSKLISQRKQDWDDVAGEAFNINDGKPHLVLGFPADHMAGNG